MRKIICMAAAFLAACGNQSPSEPTPARERRTETATTATGSLDRLNSIDAAIGWLQSKNIENPARMQELISACATSTGAQMEGEGAVRITRCVQGRWDGDNPYYADTPNYVPPSDHPGMTRDEQIRDLTREDPSSHGYTDADREFLREHGVSEAEARAIEDTLARQGLND